MTTSIWKVCCRRYHEEWNTNQVGVQACDFVNGQDSAGKPEVLDSPHFYNPISTGMVVESDIRPGE